MHKKCLDCAPPQMEPVLPDSMGNKCRGGFLLSFANTAKTEVQAAFHFYLLFTPTQSLLTSASAQRKISILYFSNFNLNYQHEHKYEQLLEEAKKLELDASSCCLLKGFQSFYILLFTWCLIITPPQSGRALCKRRVQSDWQSSSGENSGWILPPTLQVLPFQIFYVLCFFPQEPRIVCQPISNSQVLGGSRWSSQSC